MSCERYKKLLITAPVSWFLELLIIADWSGDAGGGSGQKGDEHHRKSFLNVKQRRFSCVRSINQHVVFKKNKK
jgi:hypothetical protein